MESDGGILVRQVALIEEGSADPWREDAWSYYPHLVSRVAALTTRASEAPGPSASVEEHLAFASSPHLRVRRTVAWLSLLIVPATYLLARRLLSARGAFLAAALVAFSQLDVCVSQEARAHGPAAAFSTFAVLACLRLRERPTRHAYLLAALAAGAAIGTLQSGVAVLLPLLAAHLLRERTAPGAARGSLLAGAIAGALAVLALCVLVLYPFTFRERSATDASELYMRPDGNAQFFGHTIFLEQFDGRGFAHVWGTLAAFDPVLLALALGGIALWLALDRRFTRPLLVALAYALPYLVVIGLYERTYERFVVQLLPFLACAAAWGIERLASPRPRVFFAAAGAALAVPFASAIALGSLRRAPDTAEVAGRWIAEHVKADERVALLPYADVPLVRTRAAIDDALGLGEAPKLQVLSPWMNHQTRRVESLPAAPRFDLRTPRVARKVERELAEADPIAYFKARGERYVVVPVTASNGGWEVLTTIHRAMRERATLVARIPAGDGIPLDAGDSSSWWRRAWTWSLLAGDATIGDVLEIYRVD